MAKPGRKPKPTAQKRLEGNPGKRAMGKEPRPRTKAKKPHGLATHNPKVSRLWDQYGPELERLGLLTGMDVGALRLMLQHYQFAVEAAAEVRQVGLTRKDENGVERKHPMLTIFERHSEMYRKWATEFGMTPSARTRLSVEPQAEQLGLFETLLGVVEASTSEEGR